jgi:RNA polymerase sigma-70 factor, ECF subfamily
VDRRDLVTRAGRGDHDAFAELAASVATRLDAAARLILRDPELAQDAVQEALVRAWRDLRGLRDPERFDAWLHRLLTHACLDELRRRRRRPIEVELIHFDLASAEDASRVLADRDELDRLLAGLQPEHRALLVLHYYLGMPLPEAAASLGISLTTAKSRVHRAIGLLRRSFDPETDAPVGVRGDVA